MKKPRASVMVLILWRVASTSASTIGCLPVSATMPTTTAVFDAATAGCCAPAPRAPASDASRSPAAPPGGAPREERRPGPPPHGVFRARRGLLIQALRAARRQPRQNPADPRGDR